MPRGVYERKKADVGTGTSVDHLPYPELPESSMPVPPHIKQTWCDKCQHGHVFVNGKCPCCEGILQ
jgi:hypothetical protein